jgi:hypothetical protein
MNDFYSKSSDANTLVRILEKCEAYKTLGPGFWNWSQLPLAYAFTLNKIGNSKKSK